jgi:hypothetical protein
MLAASRWRASWRAKCIEERAAEPRDRLGRSGPWAPSIDAGSFQLTKGFIQHDPGGRREVEASDRARRHRDLTRQLLGRKTASQNGRVALAEK